MQHSPHDIKEKLLKALDKDYNVVDMPVVVEIIGILERAPITKEDLETTRLGKYVNELRRKTTNEQVAKRAKDLVRKWRDMITPHVSAGGEGGVNGTRGCLGGVPGRIVSPAIGQALSPGSWNRNSAISPALSLKRSQPASPASRINSLSPDSRLTSSPGSQKLAISPNISPRSQAVSSRVNQGSQLPHSSGEGAPGIAGAGTIPARTCEQSGSPAGPRPRGRPPLNRAGSEPLKSPTRGRGRPPSEQAEGEPPRGRGRPPLDPSKTEQRGRGRPPLSSPPSGTPRGRGRPPKNKNKLKKLASSPESNQNSNLVPKTSPANKRLRKSSDEEDDPASKRQKLNGAYDCKVPDLVNSKEEKAGEDPSQVPSEQIKIPKKRGRKKGSKNAPKTLSFDRYEEDVVKEKMASIVRNPKVKTTRELLESIQKESSLECLRKKTLSSLGVEGDKSKCSSPSRKLLCKSDMNDFDMTLSKTEHIHKFLRSQNEVEEDFGHRSLEFSDHRRPDSDLPLPLLDGKPESRPLSRASDAALPTPVSYSSKSPEAPLPIPADEDIIDVEKIDPVDDEPPRPGRPETVEEILAKLPAIRPGDISWSDSESEGSSVSDEESRRPVVTDSDVDRLHEDHIEGVNGNWNEGEFVKGLNHGLKVPIARWDTESEGESEDEVEARRRGGGEEVSRSRSRNKKAEAGGKKEKQRHEDNFREWQECVSKRSFNGELLHILPYVIID